MNALTPEQVAQLQSLLAAVNTNYLSNIFGSKPITTVKFGNLPVHTHTDDPDAKITVTTFVVIGGL